MSSLRVRAQNKLMAKLGAAKPSRNVQFESAFAEFERAADGVAALELALRAFSSAMRTFHSSGAMVLRAADNLATQGGSSDEMKHFSAEFKAAFTQVDTNVANESLSRYEKSVLRPASGWQHRVQALKHEIATFQDEKLIFDHYTRKVMSLRESRDKRLGSGKAEKPKEVEKLLRNEQKLAAATSSYTKMSDETVKNLNDFVNSRESTLVPLLERVLEFRAQYAKRIEEESRRMQEMVRHEPSMLDKVLGKLEALLPQKTHPASVESAGANVSTEPEVHNLKFEEFTGEAAPQNPKNNEVVDTNPANYIAKHDDVRTTAHAITPRFESDAFNLPPAPPMFPTQFDTPEEQDKRSSSGFFASHPPPPPFQSNISPPAPTSPVSMPMTPWDDMGSSSTTVAVPVFNHESEQLSSSWPPPVNSTGVFSNIAANTTTETNGDSQRHNSHSANAMHQFPTNFQKLHANALNQGMNAGTSSSFPSF